jgi:septal ring factor EnvC (AmiA/AmiB activator)
MFAFLAGWRLYALVGIGLAFLALAGVICVQRLEHKADVASLALAKQNLESVSNALKQSEADKADLARKAQELDAAIKERDSRLRALNETKRKLADELDRIKKALPAPDQGCLSRDLPSPLLDLLRDGPADRHEDGASPGPGKPVPPLQ